jgi:hypothetical protein
MKYLNNFLFIIIVQLLNVQISIAEQANNFNSLTFGNYNFNIIQSFGSLKNYESTNKEDNIIIRSLVEENKAIAENFIEDRIEQFKSIYSPKRVDYPGQYSKTITCPIELQPTFFKSNDDKKLLSYFVGYATKNKVAGACIPDLVHYKHFYGILYCSNIKTLYEIEGFFDSNSLEILKFIEEIKCN